ncbi:MAG: hypothetical protein M1812_000314 [Candelaria pacifica]|nr:MAG: hypothetical protein M1812_000314 [Candelaria pacifica]
MNMNALISMPALLVSLFLLMTSLAGATINLDGKGSIDTFDYLDITTSNSTHTTNNTVPTSVSPQITSAVAIIAAHRTSFHLPTGLSIPNGFPHTPQGLPQMNADHRHLVWTHTITAREAEITDSRVVNSKIQSLEIAVDCLALGAVNCHLPVPGMQPPSATSDAGSQESTTTSPGAVNVSKIYDGKRGYPQNWMNLNMTSPSTTIVQLMEVQQSTLTSMHTSFIAAQTTTDLQPGIFLPLGDISEGFDNVGINDEEAEVDVTVDNSSLSTITSSPNSSSSVAAETSPSPTLFSSSLANSSLGTNASTMTTTVQLQLFPGHYFELSNWSNRWCAVSVLTYVVPFVMLVILMVMW